MIRRSFLMLIFFSGFLKGTSYASEVPLPSAENCQFYSILEDRLQCGPKQYLKKVGLPLCEYYLQNAPSMPKAIQDWFPKVRLCLQTELTKDKETLTCDNLDQRAEKTHLTCYIKTDYCKLDFSNKMYLTTVTAFKLPVSWWLKMLSVVNQACLPNSKM